MVKNSKIDKVLIAVTLLLVLIGLIMIYSSTMILAKEKYGDSFYFLKRQLISLGVGLLVFFLVAFSRYPVYLNQKWVMILVALAIIGLLLVFATGKINQSYRWIKILGTSVQPSEFAKIAVVLYLSFMLGKKDHDVNQLKKTFVMLIPVFIMMILILREPDYGTFALIFLVSLFLLFIAGLRLKYLLIALLLFSVTLSLLIKFNPDRMNRILAFLHPEEYAASYSFQTMQSVYAVGSGGIFGQGLGGSTQKLFFLPYAYTDFIFAIIGEEVGILGALLVMMFFFTFLIRGIHIAKFSDNRHCYLLVIGLTFMIVMQAMLNISVTIGILPTKGIALPFISSGGSSLVTSLLITGIILNVSRHRKMELVND